MGYTYGMTMKRDEKREATSILKGIQAGNLTEQAHSPKLRREMIADHGAPTYNAAAWIAHRMGRRGPGTQPSQPAEAIRERNATTKIQALRKVTKK